MCVEEELAGCGAGLSAHAALEVIAVLDGREHFVEGGVADVDVRAGHAWDDAVGKSLASAVAGGVHF